MGENEKKKWTETRKQGLIKYAIFNSLKSTILCVAIYVFGNAYVNKDEIDQYINDNIVTALNYNLMVVGITFVILFFISLIVFKINENRFEKSTK